LMPAFHISPKWTKLFGLGPGMFARAFSPLDISGLALWLDASDSTTLFQDSAGTTPAVANNDPVGLWKDKSGNARNASQATSANKPALLLNQFNGRPAVKADGSDDLLSFTSFVTGAAFTLYIVAAPNTINVNAEYFFASSGMGFYFGGVFEGINGYGMNDGTNTRRASEEPTALSVFTFQPVALYRNGIEATYSATDTVGSVTITQLYVRTGGNRSDASIGELLLYGATHDAATRVAVWAYLNSRWVVY
jgi:hypothetical protein